MCARQGKKLRFLPLQPVASERVFLYLAIESIGQYFPTRPLFFATSGPKDNKSSGLSASGIYNLVKHYVGVAGIAVQYQYCAFI